MTELDKYRDRIAEEYWLIYREGCHYPGYWEKPWATLVRQNNDELGQRYVESCREFANRILAKPIANTTLREILTELEELGGEIGIVGEGKLPHNPFIHQSHFNTTFPCKACAIEEYQGTLKAHFKRVLWQAGGK